MLQSGFEVSYNYCKQYCRCGNMVRILTTRHSQHTLFSSTLLPHATSTFTNKPVVIWIAHGASWDTGASVLSYLNKCYSCCPLDQATKSIRGPECAVTHDLYDEQMSLFPFSTCTPALWIVYGCGSQPVCDFESFAEILKISQGVNRNYKVLWSCASNNCNNVLLYITMSSPGDLLKFSLEIPSLNCWNLMRYVIIANQKLISADPSAHMHYFTSQSQNCLCHWCNGLVVKIFDSSAPGRFLQNTLSEIDSSRNMNEMIVLQALSEFVE